MSNNPVSYIDPSGGVDVVADLANGREIESVMYFETESQMRQYYRDKDRDARVGKWQSQLEKEWYEDHIRTGGAPFLDASNNEWDAIAVVEGYQKLIAAGVNEWDVVYSGHTDYGNPLNGGYREVHSKFAYNSAYSEVKRGESSWVDNVQTTLDLAGIADPTGVVDGVNAIIYLGRGRWADAGISALALIPYIGDAGKAGRLAAKAGANLSSNGVKLAKQLASEAQMAEKGRVIIGSGTLKEASRLAHQYGGNTSDWVKKTSSSFTKNGTTFETHWYENISNGMRTEFKTKLP